MHISSLMRIFIPGAFLVSGGYAAAQSLRFQKYTVEEGLPSDRVNDIIQDKEGFLWCATQNGLTRFDGFDFRPYAPLEGRTLNIKSVIQDRQGHIWFGTFRNGLYRFDGREFHQYTEKDGLASDLVMDVYEDSRGAIWAACWQGGISRLDGDRFISYTRQQGLPDIRAYVIQEDSEGHLWFGTANGVAQLAGDSLHAYTIGDTRYSNWIWDIYRDRKGLLWFGTSDGVFQRTTAGICPFNLPLESSPLSNKISKIRQDRSGNYWFSVQRKGVLRYDGTAFRLFDQQDGLSDEYIRAIYEDTERNLWLGFNGSGMGRFDSDAILRYADPEGVPGGVVSAMAEDHEGHLLISTISNGLCRYDGAVFHAIDHDYSPRRFATVMLTDTQGRVWIGTRWDGIRMLRQGQVHHFTERQGLCSNEIVTIKEDSHGNIWFGTNKGLIRYDGQYWKNYSVTDGLPNERIDAIGEDRKGYLWFGSVRSGGVRFKNGVFTPVVAAEEIGNIISKLKTDGNGDLWILANSGVFRFDGERIHRYTRNDGLPSDFCNVIINGARRLYIGSEEGLACWDAADSTFKPMALNNRLFVSGIRPEAAFEDRSGDLWFGTESGFFRISPDKLPPAVPPSTLFTKFSIHGTTVYNFHEQRIPYDKNHIDLDYIGLHLSDPRGVRYRYSVPGYDAQWHETHNRTLSFPDLAPGKYTLHVQSRYRQGAWSEPATVTFTLMPPFWATLWFRVLAGMLGLAAVGFVHITRTRRMAGRNRLLEDEVQKRTASLIIQQNILAGRERTIRALMNASSAAAALVDVHGHFLDMNEVMAARFHRRPDELLGVNSFTLMPPELLLTRYRIFQNVLETGVYRQFEDSREGLILENTYYPIKDIIGNTASVAVFSRDITEERAAESELLTREKRYRTLIETIPYGVTENDLQGRITFSNDVHCAIFRCSKEQILGAYIWELLDDPAEQKALQNYLQFLIREQPMPTQYASKCRRFDGTVFDVLADWNYQYDEHGRVSGFIAIMADVTERNRLEAERVAYQEKLRTMASELSMTEERERKKFAVDLHDSVGQYLSLAKLRLSTLLNRNNSTDLQDTLIEVQKNLSAALQETRSLSFELSPPTLHQFGLEAAVEWLLDEVHGKHHLAVKIEQNIENCEIDSDIRSELFRDVRELVNNIIKHAKATAVRVEMHVHQAVITIVVTDNGCGFDLEQTAQRNTRHSYGLFSIRERLTALGGTFELESAAGKGTVATIIAPICRYTPVTQG